ncbi:MAG: hypothetical protein GQ574_18955 [Crocinitomix sp.]|nr:hypothetical protein [Crocinitomix sp.]
MPNKHEKACFGIFAILTFLILLLNLQFLSIDLFGYLAPFFLGGALLGYLISLLFYFAAKKRFSIETLTPSNKRSGWTAVILLVATNVLANWAGVAVWVDICL